MRKCYFLLAILALLLQATQLHAVEWLTANGTNTGPDGKKFWQNDAAGNGYTSLPSGTQYCRIYQDNGQDGDQTRNFPDGTLRFRVAKAMGYPKSKYGDIDKSREFYITKEQALAITSLDLSANGGQRINRITGIQIFENLQNLYLSGNNLGWGVIPLHVLYPKKSNGEYDYANPYHPWTGINRNQLTGTYSWTSPFTGASETRRYEHRYLGYMLRFFRHLTYVDASDCNLKEFFAGGFDSDHLDNLEHVVLSDNPDLYHVNVDYSHVDNLTLSGCTGLTTLFASRTDLESIDLTDNSALQTLYMPNNSKFKTIVHNGTYNDLLYMDFKNCPLLTDIDHLEQCPNLGILKCQNCSISTLDFHANTQLRMLLCSDNYLTELDVKDHALVRLECANNQLTSLDCSGTSNSTLNYLDCSGNKLTTINVSDNTDLETLYCYSNLLTSLSLENNTKLKKLRISNNAIPKLDLTNNSEIEDFYMNNCGMDSVNNLENLTNLKIFMANNNDLTNMDFSKLTKLETFQASQNKFTDLDLTAQTKLRTLLCDGQGGYADFTGRTLRTLKLNSDSLTALKCDNNRLITLDLSNCPNLTYQGFIGATQRDVQDLRVFDHSKICVELPNGALGFGDANEDPLNYFYTWEKAKTGGGHVSNFDLAHSDVIEREGKQWLVIYDIEKGSKKQDANFYKNTIAYCYYLWGAWNDGAAGTVNENGEPDEALGKSKYFAEQNRKIATTDYNISTKGTGIEIKVNPDRLNNNIQVYTYPYVMYVNPASQDLYAQSEGRDDNNFYSGTIILPYDAIVPEGTTAYIAKNIRIAKDEIYTTEHDGEKKVVEDQMLLIPLEPGYEDDDPNTDKEDVVIPAFTAVYVKADTENGLFGFDRKELKGYTSEHLAKVRNENNELVAVSEVKNILEGNVIKDETGKDSAIVDLVLGAGDYKKYLTLGRGVVSNITYERDPSTGKISDQSFVQNQSRIGFWPFTGSKIPAHRVFIRAEQLDSAVVEQGPAATSGLLFKFLDNDNDNINTTTSIQSSRLNALTKEGWYTISGIRLKGRPTTKGVYIHNGRKEVIE